MVKLSKTKRRFDEDLDNELRVLEELYYYTYDEESAVHLTPKSRTEKRRLHSRRQNHEDLRSQARVQRGKFLQDNDHLVQQAKKQPQQKRERFRHNKK